MTVRRPELTGDVAAVASTHWLASGAAMAVLDRGGNAFDAAVAAGFVLQVVEPHSNGLGGDVAIALYSPTAGAGRIICGQGPTPAAATIEAFDALGVTQIPGAGLLPACVPGAFGAWLRLLAEYGTMSLAAVLEPAIGYAAAGYPLLPSAANTIAALAPLFRTEWTESARTFLPHGQPPVAGSRMRNPVLARTFERLVEEARSASGGRQSQIEAAHNAFYQGFVAEAVDAFARTTEVFDPTGRRHRGLLTGDDLAGWRPTVEQPTAAAYGDLTVLKPGPWSQGPVFLQQLALLDGDDLTAAGLNSVDHIHLLAEAAKLAFADREAFYGDPDRVSVPMDELLDPGYARRRRSLITERAATDPGPGLPCVDPWLPGPRAQQPQEPPADEPWWLTQLRSGVPTVGAVRAGAGNTTTVAVMDRAGNLVVAVPSGGWLKSSPVIPGLGFSLGTRAQTMWLSPGHPNSLAPRKRPRTTLSPGIVLRDGEPFLALGTPGGDQQDQWTLQTMLAATRFGLGLQAATEIPAFHIDHFPQSFAPRTARPGFIVVEDSHDPAVLEGLRARGHRLDVVPAHTLGKVCAVGIDPVSGFLRAAAGPRGRQAYAICR